MTSVWFTRAGLPARGTRLALVLVSFDRLPLFVVVSQSGLLLNGGPAPRVEQSWLLWPSGLLGLASERLDGVGGRQPGHGQNAKPPPADLLLRGLHEAALLDDLLDERRERLGLKRTPGRLVGDDAGVGVHDDPVTVR